jgi:hypothetical protein
MTPRTQGGPGSGGDGAELLEDAEHVEHAPVLGNPSAGAAEDVDLLPGDGLAGRLSVGHLKDLELANLPTTTLAEVADATTQGIHRVCASDSLVVGFLAHTGLTLDP